MIMRSWEHLIKPYKIAFSKESDSNYTETIAMEPLEPGFGVTLGNALRRVLLSSIQGSAITSVKIAGTLLEFSTLPGIIEDVPDIILNLKSLDLRLNGEENTRTFKIKAEGPCIVTSDMIEGKAFLDILSPSQFICTVTEGHTFEAEITVSRGKGYVSAPPPLEKRLLGEIALDARFNPVKKVSYKVEHTRVAHSTDYDRLLLTLETDGSISPRDAVSEAANILRDQLVLFMSFDPDAFKTATTQVEVRPVSSSLPPILFTLVKELDLPVRCLNCLKNAEIVYVGDLVKKREIDLLRTPNFGRKSLDDIKAVLSRFDLMLGMDFPDWPPEQKAQDQVMVG